MDNAKLRKEVVEYAAGLGVEIAPKEDSWLMRRINNIIGFFNPGFMDNFITTIGKTVYFPKAMLGPDQNESVWSVMPHETQHGMQFKRLTLFGAALVYLFPHWLALLSLLALGAIWGDWGYLLCLINLVWLAPWPAPGRKWMEMQGYALTLLVMYEEYRARGYEDEVTVPPYVIRQFTGPNYYFMWPSKSRVQAELNEWLEKVKDGRIDKELPIAADFRKILRENLEEN